MDSNADISKTKEEMQSEIEALQKDLRRTQTCFHEHQVQSNLKTTSLRAQLNKKEHEVRYLQMHQDRQVEKIVSHLLFLEGQIYKDQKQAINLLVTRDQKIKDQQAQIKYLTNYNSKLVAAVRDLQLSAEASNEDQMDNRHIVKHQESVNRGYSDKMLREKQKLHKLRMNLLGDRLRRHQSSLELYHSEPLETLEETVVRSSSQENVSEDGKPTCRERPRSMIEMSQHSNEYPLLKFPEEKYIIEDEVYDKINDDGIFTNGSEEWTNVGKSTTGPKDTSSVVNGHKAPTKARPHSMSSLELYSEKVNKSNNFVSQTAAQQQSPGDLNPFKSIKTMLKRKGSKLRHKKRSVSLPQGVNYEYTAELRKHREK